MRVLAQIRREKRDVEGTRLWPRLWQEDRRCAALMEILRRLPDDVFERLVDRKDKFMWFIPDRGTHGSVECFPPTVDREPRLVKREPGETHYSDEQTEEVRTIRWPAGQWKEKCDYAVVIYLDPRLERAAWVTLVGTIVHELAHVALRHPVWPSKGGTAEDVKSRKEREEKEAWELGVEWGFEREVKKAWASVKAKQTKSQKAGRVRCSTHGC